MKEHSYANAYALTVSVIYCNNLLILETFVRNTVIINNIIVSLIIRPDILQLHIINENITRDIPLNGKLAEV